MSRLDKTDNERSEPSKLRNAHRISGNEHRGISMNGNDNVKDIIYASDLDRTLIFSGRFLEENPSKCEKLVAEAKGERVISYVSKRVRSELKEVSNMDGIYFMPVTTRSLEEYQRVSLGFIPRFAITSNGALILRDGEVDKEWSDFVKSHINMAEMLQLRYDIMDIMNSVDYDVKIIDGSYLFFKTCNEALYDAEEMELAERYKGYVFTRQRNKCYAIPKHFSKAIALRWLWHKLGKPYIIASGDSQLDLPMLALANEAIIPDHGALYKEKYVLDGRIISGGIESPLKNIERVKEVAQSRG